VLGGQTFQWIIVIVGKGESDWFGHMHWMCVWWSEYGEVVWDFGFSGGTVSGYEGYRELGKT